MQWYDLPMFTRIMFVIGFLVSIGIFSFLIGTLVCWTDIKLSHREARQKSKSAEPVDFQGLEFAAPSRRKQLRRELHESMKREGSEIVEGNRSNKAH
jgi:hypothetical protein